MLPAHTGFFGTSLYNYVRLVLEIRNQSNYAYSSICFREQDCSLQRVPCFAWSTTVVLLAEGK